MSSHSYGPAVSRAGVPATEGSGIYLYRRGALAAYAQPFRVLVDGQTAGFIGNASYLPLRLAPGSHHIQVAPGGLAQVTTLHAHADADGWAYYEYVFPTGMNMRPSFQGATLEARDAQQAREVLPALQRMTALQASQDTPNRPIPDD